MWGEFYPYNRSGIPGTPPVVGMCPSKPPPWRQPDFSFRERKKRAVVEKSRDKNGGWAGEAGRLENRLRKGMGVYLA